MIRFLNKYQLTEFILLILAMTGRFIFMRLFFLYGLIASCFYLELRKYLKSCAYITDVEGNVKGKYVLEHFVGGKFGNPLASISYEIGKSKSLYKFGRWIKRQLNKVEKDHCEIAVKELNNRIQKQLFQ